MCSPGKMFSKQPTFHQSIAEQTSLVSLTHRLIAVGAKDFRDRTAGHAPKQLRGVFRPDRTEQKAI